MKNTLVLENINISLVSIRSHLLRTILTIMIISFGIMALVGILTATDSIKYYLTQNFSMMGSNTLTIRNRSMNIHMGGNDQKEKRYEPITYIQAQEFKDRFDFPAYTSVFTRATGIATLKYETHKTNPNVRVIGADENYLVTSGDEVEKGRNFTANEIYYGFSSVILGSGLIKDLFKNKEDPLGKIISIGPGKFKIIGVLKSKGSSMGFSGDQTCFIPVTNVRTNFPRADMSFNINVMAKRPELVDAADLRHGAAGHLHLDHLLDHLGPHVLRDAGHVRPASLALAPLGGRLEQVAKVRGDLGGVGVLQHEDLDLGRDQGLLVERLDDRLDHVEVQGLGPHEHRLGPRVGHRHDDGLPAGDDLRRLDRRDRLAHARLAAARAPLAGGAHAGDHRRLGVEQVIEHPGDRDRVGVLDHQGPEVGLLVGRGGELVHQRLDVLQVLPRARNDQRVGRGVDGDDHLGLGRRRLRRGGRTRRGAGRAARGDGVGRDGVEDIDRVGIFLARLRRPRRELVGHFDLGVGHLPVDPLEHHGHPLGLGLRQRNHPHPQVRALGLVVQAGDDLLDGLEVGLVGDRGHAVAEGVGLDDGLVGALAVGEHRVDLAGDVRRVAVGQPEVLGVARRAVGRLVELRQQVFQHGEVRGVGRNEQGVGPRIGRDAERGRVLLPALGLGGEVLEELLDALGHIDGLGVLQCVRADLQAAGRAGLIELLDHLQHGLHAVGRPADQEAVGVDLRGDGNVGLVGPLARRTGARGLLRQALVDRIGQRLGLGVLELNDLDGLPRAILRIERSDELPGQFDLVRRALHDHGIAVGQGGHAGLRPVGGLLARLVGIRQHRLEHGDDVGRAGELQAERLHLAGRPVQGVDLLHQFVDRLELLDGGGHEELVAAGLGLELRLGLGRAGGLALGLHLLLRKQAREHRRHVGGRAGLEGVRAELHRRGHEVHVQACGELDHVFDLLVRRVDHQRAVVRAGGDDDGVGLRHRGARARASLGLDGAGALVQLRQHRRQRLGAGALELQRPHLADHVLGVVELGDHLLKELSLRLRCADQQHGIRRVGLDEDLLRLAGARSGDHRLQCLRQPGGVGRLELHDLDLVGAFAGGHVHRLDQLDRRLHVAGDPRDDQAVGPQIGADGQARDDLPAGIATAGGVAHDGRQGGRIGVLQFDDLGAGGLGRALIEVGDELVDHLELPPDGRHQQAVVGRVHLDAGSGLVRRGLLAGAALGVVGQQAGNRGSEVAGVGVGQLVDADILLAGGQFGVEALDELPDGLDLVLGGLDNQRAIIGGGRHIDGLGGARARLPGAALLGIGGGLVEL